MRRPTKKIPPLSPWPARITWLAFGLALALVMARATTQEFLREPFEVTPGSDPMPRTAGPGTSIGLDLLCCLPALLVLLRGAIDKTFALRSPRSFIPLALLSGWMLLSTIWAADKFAALVTGFQWLAAAAILWAMAQIVRDWIKLRLAAAMLFSLLSVYVIQGINYRLLEAPQTLEMWQKNRPKMLAEHGFVEGTFAARQFEDKLRLMEMFGFFSSPNTFGAAISLLLVLGVGLLAQRLAEGDANRWAVPALAIQLLAGLVVMGLTRSRGAVTTFALCLIMFAVLWRFRDSLARHAKGAFIAGVAAIVAALAAVVAYGLARGRLPSSTMTFRWQYWVATARMIRSHPWLGTGWSNFSLDYLAYRLPNAPEEIKDPHNFLVRFLSELGIAGGALVIAWLARLWWELTRPILPALPPPPSAANKGPGVVKFAAAIAAGATMLFLFAAVDWAREPVEDFLLLRLLFLGAMILSASLAALRTPHSQEPDDRPAPWALYGFLLAAGGMLIHNLIDFSMFETGPMFLLAMVLGSALGIRSAATPFSGGPEGQALTPRDSTIRRALPLALGCIAWLTVALLLWGPLLTADHKAAQSDDARRVGEFSTAERLLAEANTAAWGLNADYAFRAARSAAQVSPPDHWQPLMALAIREDSKDGTAYRGDAAAELLKAQPDPRRVRRDYGAAIRLDPNNVPLHLEYAAILADRLHDPAAARAQYHAALDKNDQLNPDEKKRLSAEEVRQIQAKIDVIGGS